MNYQQIIDASNGRVKGIHEYNQGEDAVKENIDIRRGFCRALIILWLKSKADATKSDFWGVFDIEETDIKKPLISMLAKAEDLQGDYAKAFESRFAVDDATNNALKASGLTYNINDVIGTDRAGFTTIDDQTNSPERIANKVINADSRFFILSIGGTDGNHSVGVFRQKSFFGGKTVNVFDPNIGEFQVDGIEDFEHLLIQINNVGYPNTDLNTNFILWPFKQ
jgi:hypothetical protein